MPRVIAQVKVVPLGTGSTSLSSYVAGVQTVLDTYPNLKSRLTPMATVIEGDIDEIFRAVREMHETPFGSGALRVSTQLSIDDRRDKNASMDKKIQSVQNRLK